ncbi:uncharacterized protein VTP21DRAFT_5875 [Calcarisporiella thermophila]|uniref:uncharacterized protein n=1 Tax=Calcarisporiella thermophila TaxID=911321 RepID=UPI0037440914
MELDLQFTEPNFATDIFSWSEEVNPPTEVYSTRQDVCHTDSEALAIGSDLSWSPLSTDFPQSSPVSPEIFSLLTRGENAQASQVASVNMYDPFYQSCAQVSLPANGNPTAAKDKLAVQPFTVPSPISSVHPFFPHSSPENSLTEEQNNVGCDPLLQVLPPPLQPYQGNPSSHDPSSNFSSSPPPSAPLRTRYSLQLSKPPRINSSKSSQGPVTCPLFNCGKTFTRYHNLRAHLRTHEATRPFACSSCPRAFTRKHDLQRHMRVHTGDKPYTCPCCSKGFARTDAMKRHFKVEEVCRNSPLVQAMRGRRYRRYSSAIL